jgi:hypothetical protein
MSGGGSEAPSMSQVQQAAPFKPLPTSDIQPNMGPQFGPTATQNPYVAGNTPDWAQGHFAMPWWGLDPMGQPLTQEQMMYQAPPPPPEQQQQAQQPVITPEQLQQLQYQDWLNGRAAMEAQIGVNNAMYAGDGDNWVYNSGPTSLYGTQYDPRTEWQYKPEVQWSDYDRMLAERSQAIARAHRR